MRRFWLLFLIAAFQCSCTGQDQKINGVSFVGGREVIDASHIEPVINVSANWACVMPFGFVRNLQATDITFNIERQWWGERRVGAKKTAELFQTKGIKVMIKPQLWVWRGEFTGHIKMNSDADWEQFEKGYEAFIMEYADLAQEINADMLCIGTELNRFVMARPKFWKALISKVREVYKGKLTYAENWDTFDKVPFWSELDYVGVDAYFPLCEEKTPSLESLREGWQKHKTEMNRVSEASGRPILFTEYGYRSIDYTGKEPWKVDRSQGGANLEAQKNALQALYDEFWKEDWFAGGFVWKWFHYHDRAGGTSDNRFTPQNKPAEQVIKAHYETW